MAAAIDKWGWEAASSGCRGSIAARMLLRVFQAGLPPSTRSQHLRQARGLAQRLSTGRAVAQGRDGPAALIAGLHLGQARVKHAAALQNGQQATAFAGMADASLAEVASSLMRAQALLTEAGDAGRTGRGGQALRQVELDHLLAGIDRLAETSRFKDRHLFRPPAGTAKPQVVGGLRGEAIQVDAGSSGPEDWRSVLFAAPITDAVVVAGPVSDNDPDPAVVRVRNVTDDGFEFLVEEFEYQNTPAAGGGAHGTERLSFLALPGGRHTLPDGSVYEAGTLAHSTAGRTFNFSSPFDDTPTLLHSITSQNNADLLAPRVESLSATGFVHRGREQEAGGNHPDETLSYIAFRGLGGTLGGVAVASGSTGDTVNSTPRTVQVPTAGPGAVVLAQMTTRDGGDTSFVRLTGVGSGSISVKIGEEQSANSELGHTTEAVDYLVLAEAGELELVAPTVYTQPDPGAPDRHTFALGPDPASGRSELVLGRVDTLGLGLEDLRSGGGLALEAAGGSDLGEASTRVDAALERVLEMRARVGTFQRHVAETSQRLNASALESVSAAESATLDLDYAEATAAWARLRVLEQVGDWVQRSFDQRAEGVLALLAA